MTRDDFQTTNFAELQPRRPATAGLLSTGVCFPFVPIRSACRSDVRHGPVRQMIAQDLPERSSKCPQAGFQAIELCSPVGYGVGFGGQSKYRGAELRKISR